MTAGLLIGHRRTPYPVRIQVVTGLVEKALRVCLGDPGREPLANQAALAVPAVGIEPVADDALAVADDVGDHSHEAGGHFREINVGVADG